jgi:hypothetical protein
MKELNYFIVSNELISTTEPIEESLRERNQSLQKNDEFKTDFWVINSKNIIKNDFELYNSFKNSIIFKKLQSTFFSNFSNLNTKNFTVILTTNKIFIDWINLKIPNLTENKRYELLFAFNKIRKEFRNEKIFIMFILNFVFLSLDDSLENISFM